MFSGQFLSSSSRSPRLDVTIIDEARLASSKELFRIMPLLDIDRAIDNLPHDSPMRLQTGRLLYF